MRALAPHGITDQRHCIRGILVLPHADHSPASLLGQAIGLAVPFDVSPQLRGPVVGIGSGRVAVGRTPVPEAPIHEDRYPTADPNYVGASTNTRER